MWAGSATACRQHQARPAAPGPQPPAPPPPPPPTHHPHTATVTGLPYHPPTPPPPHTHPHHPHLQLVLHRRGAQQRQVPLQPLRHSRHLGVPAVQRSTGRVPLFEPRSELVLLHRGWLRGWWGWEERLGRAGAESCVCDGAPNTILDHPGPAPGSAPPARATPPPAPAVGARGPIKAGTSPGCTAAPPHAASPRQRTASSRCATARVRKPPEAIWSRCRRTVASSGCPGARRSRTILSAPLQCSRMRPGQGGR